MSKPTRTAIVAGLLILLASATFACDLSFVLTDPNNSSRTVVPGKAVQLTEGEAYSLTVRFAEDHGNCPLAPQETVFLLEEEKWKSSKDYLPLKLSGGTVWTSRGARDHETVLCFRAEQKGQWELEIIRDRTRRKP